MTIIPNSVNKVTHSYIVTCNAQFTKPRLGFSPFKKYDMKLIISTIVYIIQIKYNECNKNSH